MTRFVSAVYVPSGSPTRIGGSVSLLYSRLLSYMYWSIATVRLHTSEVRHGLPPQAQHTCTSHSHNSTARDARGRQEDRLLSIPRAGRVNTSFDWGTSATVRHSFWAPAAFSKFRYPTEISICMDRRSSCASTVAGTEQSHFICIRHRHGSPQK